MISTSKPSPAILPILGAIGGDMIGSVYEWGSITTKEFPLFHETSGYTDDSVMTIAVANALMNDMDFTKSYRHWGSKYPHAGYGGFFLKWLKAAVPAPCNSFGNGSAMRASPAGCLFNSLDQTLEAAKMSAQVTHNHPEGIKGAQATAASIFLARSGKGKKQIRDFVTSQFGYNLNQTVDSIRPSYSFNETCQRTVPEAIVAFLDSTDYEDAIRNAVSLGGDSDTLACITGSIAAAFYKQIPDQITQEIIKRLPEEMMSVLKRFEKFVLKKQI